jgi:hypothetical protein
MTKPKDDSGFDLFTGSYREQHVVTCPQGTVVYKLTEKDDPIALLKHHLHPAEITAATDQTIRDILATNPDAEFTPDLQAALGITVISFQKAPQRAAAAEWDVGY